MNDEQRKENRARKMRDIAEHFGHTMADTSGRGWSVPFVGDDGVEWPNYERDNDAYMRLEEQLPATIYDEQTASALRFQVESVRVGNKHRFVAGYGSTALKFSAAGSSLREALINLARELAKRDEDVERPRWEV